jgi:indole-3-glycerol phosphate synthase
MARSDILQEIITAKRAEIAELKKIKSLQEISHEAELIKTKSNFVANIENFLDRKKTAIIAEIKKASPSKGIIRDDFDVAEIANIYAKCGAAAISVLTDKEFFQGDASFIKIAKANSELPILRKDFIIDPYQIYESKILGADAVLLIASCLTAAEMVEFEEIAIRLGLDVLVESHNGEELARSLQLKTKLIGINNRNLNDFSVSLDNCVKLKKKIPAEKIIIAESGINNPEEVEYLRSNEINCLLIGSSLMQETNIAAKFSSLINN